MIVRLTGREIQVVGRRLPDQFDDLWAEHQDWTSRCRANVSMAAIAWLMIRERLTEELYGPRGGHTGPAALRNAVRKITTVLNAHAQHPAMYGRAVHGDQVAKLPAWQLEPGDTPFGTTSDELRRYSPYPYRDRQFVVLGDYQIRRRGFLLTAWRPTLPDSDVFHQEASHLVFGRQVHAGRVEDLDRSGVE